MAKAPKKEPAYRAKRWSQHVAETSDALTLEHRVFTKRSARAIALSLKKSAEQSKRRKSAPFRSAMSMLNFYINRMGSNLKPGTRKILERAKVELRDAFGRGKSGKKIGDKPRLIVARKSRKAGTHQVSSSSRGHAGSR